MRDTGTRDTCARARPATFPRPRHHTRQVLIHSHMIMPLDPWWRITQPRMAVRAEMTISSKAVAVLHEGAVVSVATMDTDQRGFRWLGLSMQDVTALAPRHLSAWILLDGAAVGLAVGSTLLQPAPPLAMDAGENRITIPWEETLHPQSRGADRRLPRFLVFPAKPGWAGKLEQLNICVHASGEHAIGEASSHKVLASALSKPPRPGCILVACNHHVAIFIARHKDSLRRAGWKVACSSEADVAELADKRLLRARAERLGVLDALPAYYENAARATYPCVLKPADGEHGRDVRIVRSASEAHLVIGGAVGGPRSKADASRVNGHRATTLPSWLLGQPPPSSTPSADASADVSAELTLAGPNAAGGGRTGWVLQELIPGAVEYATSLIVRDGRILDLVCTQYTFEEAEYVWPRVDEKRGTRLTQDTIPVAHLRAMGKLLTRFTGVCNFNYKVRAAEADTLAYRSYRPPPPRLPLALLTATRLRGGLSVCDGRHGPTAGSPSLSATRDSVPISPATCRGGARASFSSVSASACARGPQPASRSMPSPCPRRRASRSAEVTC